MCISKAQKHSFTKGSEPTHSLLENLLVPPYLQWCLKSKGALVVPAVSAHITHVMMPSCPWWVWKQVLSVPPPPSPRLASVPISSVQRDCPPPLTVRVYLDLHCAPSTPSTGPDGRCTAIGGPSFECFSLGLSFLHVCFISSLASASWKALLCSPYFPALHVLFCMWLPLSIQSPQDTVHTEGGTWSHGLCPQEVANNFRGIL